MKLEVFLAALSSEQSHQQDDDEALEASTSPRKWWQSSLAYGLFVLLLGTIIGVLGKNTFANQAVTDIGTILAILGIGLIGFDGIRRMMAGSSTSQKAKSMPPKKVTVKLPPTVEPGSITEQTTRKLDLTLKRDETRTPGKELL